MTMPMSIGRGVVGGGVAEGGGGGGGGRERGRGSRWDKKGACT